MSPPEGRPVIRAAGGVVWRTGRDGIEVVVIHRPAPRNDWSLPKGKLEPGERHRDAARREVHEETGLRCRLGEQLGEIRYPMPGGEEKRIRWWEMTVVDDGGFTPGREVDERRWVPIGDLDEVLSWPTDAAVIARFLQHRR